MAQAHVDDLVALNRVDTDIMESVQAVLIGSINNAFHDDPRYTLFRYQDLGAWATFSAVFLCLIVFDSWFLNAQTEKLTLTRAIWYTLFWVMMACCFCGWVYFYFGQEPAFMWMSGYLLEWMLSFDNLFVFHLIFTVYGTPEHLKHRPLYLGICGAVFFRLAFIFVGEYLMHAMIFTHIVFGSFLVYTGVKTVSADNDDEDPSQNRLVQWLQDRLPFITFYDRSGAFFVRVPVNQEGQVENLCQSDSLIAPIRDPEECLETASALSPNQEKKEAYGTVDFTKAQSGEKQQWQVRATMLFLVLVCLEISDLIFAVDSVSAIVAQVNDLFLAYSSAVFAMLGLRATFFIIDVLVHMFSLLKYGVATVLVFVGGKLMVSHYYQIPAYVACIVIVASVCLSMAASVIQDQFAQKAQGKHFDDVKERLEKVKEKSPMPSPMPAQRCVA